MYLVFHIHGSGGPAYPAFLLNREFEAWSKRYSIPFKTKFHKDKLRLIFANEGEYHFFMLTWNPSSEIPRNWATFEVVDPPKH